MIDASRPRLIRLVALALLAVAALLGADQARALDTAPSAPISAPSQADRAQAQALIKTLEDPDARGKLVAQLKLLAEVQKPAAAPPAKRGPLDILADALQGAGDSIAAAAGEIADFGRVTDWMRQEAADEHDQQRFGRVLIRLAAVLVGGFVVEWLVARLLARPRHYIETLTAVDRWLRPLWAAAWWVLRLVPMAGFAASAYAMLVLPFYRPGGHSELVSVAVITAYALSSAAARLVDAIFAPRRPELRALAIGNAGAARLAFVFRRILNVGIWGYYADDALRMMGMPQAAFDSVLKLLGLIITVRLVWLMLEFRRPVAGWIRGAHFAAAASLPGGAEIERRIDGVRGSLANFWHVLAAIYVTAAFVIWALRVEGGFEFLLRASLFTAAILVAARLLVHFGVRLLDRAFDGANATHHKGAARRRRYRQLCGLALHLAIAVLAALAILEAWGADTLAWLGGDAGQRLLGAIAIIAAAIGGGIVAWELVNAAIERTLSVDPDGRPMTRSARARTLLPLMRNVFTAILVLVVAAIILDQMGVNVAPLLAGAGVLGVAIGFGSQKLVQDVITGAFMLFEDTLAVGDTVQIDSHIGTVEGMTIRTIRIRSATGELHTLPFSSVTTVVNQSRGFAYFPFTVGLSYRQDIDAAMAVMREVGAALKADPAWNGLIDGQVEVFGIDKFGDLNIVVSGQIRTRAGQQYGVGREYYRRLKRRFDELGVVIQHNPGAIPDIPPAVPAPPPTPNPPQAPAAREP